MKLQENSSDNLLKLIHKLVFAICFLIGGIIIITLIAVFQPDTSVWFKKSMAELTLEEAKKESFAKWDDQRKQDEEAIKKFWHPAALDSVKGDSEKLRQIEYGKDLIAHTAKYLGPHGSVAQITNGMNCQNCHLNAGTKIWGNNYGSVFSTYPKYRARSGREEDIYKRINDCLERSLNGKSLALDSKEMMAMKSYIEFVGSDVKKGVKAEGAGIFELAFLSRALDTAKGRILFAANCQSCHQPDGGGLLAADKIEYIYPPLWGENSYNIGAGLFRMSRFAGYIKYNMPQGVTFQKPQLTDEEAWDIAAFVNCQPRPTKDLSADWPKIEEKPVDHPFGPYADKFAELQHKFGPFKPIADEKKKQKELKEKSKPV